MAGSSRRDNSKWSYCLVVANLEKPEADLPFLGVLTFTVAVE